MLCSKAANIENLQNVAHLNLLSSGTHTHNFEIIMIDRIDRNIGTFSIESKIRKIVITNNCRGSTATYEKKRPIYSF